MNILKTLAISSLLFSQMAFAEDIKKSSSQNEESKIEKIEEVKDNSQKPLTRSERINIIIDEKKRLRSVLERRKDDDEIVLYKMYIRNTDYSDYVKGLMREAAFYMNYVIEHNDDKEMLRKEANNLAWNSICLGSILDIDADVVFTILQSTVVGEKREEEFSKGNALVRELFSELKVASKEEMNIRCYEVYKNKNEKKSNKK